MGTWIHYLCISYVDDGDGGDEEEVTLTKAAMKMTLASRTKV